MARPGTIVGLLLIILLGALSAQGQQVQSPAEAEAMAERYFSMGYYQHMAGRYELAVEYYRKAIEFKPTAQAHTFLGWSLSFLGWLDEAIEECKKAIALDPDFGNPYNDIGAYLIEKGEYEGAIPYLKKAMAAKNYCCRFFPYFNLGRVYLIMDREEEALSQFERALEIEPDYLPARLAIEAIKAKRGKAL